MSLWEQFNLRDKSPDFGRGMLYCFNYTKEELVEKRNKIVERLKAEEVELEDLGEGIALKVNKTITSKQDKKRIYALAIHLTTVNTACEYQEYGFEHHRSLEGLSKSLKNQTYDLMINQSMVDAYNFVSEVIPTTIRELRVFDCYRSGTGLNNSQRETIDDLEKFLKHQVKYFNRPKGMIVMGDI